MLNPPGLSDEPNTDLDSTRAEHTKKETKPVLDLVSYPILLLEEIRFGMAYFTFSTMALKASGLFTARSARTLRLISIPAL